jgi:hypothetical protein
LIEVAFTLPALPLHGRYEKDEASAQERAHDPFWAALAASASQGSASS